LFGAAEIIRASAYTRATTLCGLWGDRRLVVIFVAETVIDLATLANIAVVVRGATIAVFRAAEATGAGALTSSTDLFIWFIIVIVLVAETIVGLATLGNVTVLIGGATVPVGGTAKVVRATADARTTVFRGLHYNLLLTVVRVVEMVIQAGFPLTCPDQDHPVHEKYT